MSWLILSTGVGRADSCLPWLDATFAPRAPDAARYSLGLAARESSALVEEQKLALRRFRSNAVESPTVRFSVATLNRRPSRARY